MKKTFYTMATVLVLIPILTFAQETSTTRHQVYGYKDGMAMYYDVESPLENNGRGIIFIVSGGMVSGEDNLNITKPFWDFLLHEGYVLFQIYHPAHPKYRIPEAYEALQLGVEHIKQNSHNFGVDSNRMGMMGISTGGYLALLLTMSVDPEERSSSDTDGVVALMPLVDIEDPAFDASLFGQHYLDFDPALYSQESPVNHVSSDDPPVLLVHGTNDAAVNFERNSLRMKELLDDVGVQNSLLEIDGGHEVWGQPHLGEVHVAIANWFNDLLISR